VTSSRRRYCPNYRYYYRQSSHPPLMAALLPSCFLGGQFQSSGKIRRLVRSSPSIEFSYSIGSPSA